MGDGEDAALEVGEFEARGGTRLLVLGFDRARLARRASPGNAVCLPETMKPKNSNPACG